MYDNICKFIAANYSEDITKWLLGETLTLTVLEPTELLLEPIRTDSLIFLESNDLILHIEFQTDPKDDIPFRMLDYRTRLYRMYPHKQVYQVVIYLRKTNSDLTKINQFEIPGTIHRYNVIRLWELPTEQLLQSPGLLPFAVLTNTDNQENVLSNVAQQIDKISDYRKRSNIAASTGILAGLVLNKTIIQTLLNEEIMKESVIYQDILAEGETKDEVKGRKEEGISLVLKLLNRRLGTVSPDLVAQICQLNVEQLEDLGLALLDFQSQPDLVTWLNQLNE